MLFLGADASRAFDLPDLSTITDIVMNDLKKYPFHDKIIELKDVLDEEYKVITGTDYKTDIETLLTVLNLINSNEQIIHSPFSLLIHNLNKQELGKLKSEDFIECKNKIAETFINEFKVIEEQPKVQEITTLYE